MVSSVHTLDASTEGPRPKTRWTRGLDVLQTTGPPSFGSWAFGGGVHGMYGIVFLRIGSGTIIPSKFTNLRIPHPGSCRRISEAHRPKLLHTGPERQMAKDLIICEAKDMHTCCTALCRER